MDRNDYNNRDKALQDSYLLAEKAIEILEEGWNCYDVSMVNLMDMCSEVDFDNWDQTGKHLSPREIAALAASGSELEAM